MTVETVMTCEPICCMAVRDGAACCATDESSKKKERFLLFPTCGAGRLLDHHGS